jgi:type II secretory pathway pseudopilin PulG
MTTPPAGISEADCTATPVGVRAGFLEVLTQLLRQQQENERLHQQPTALATELASLRERIGRNSRNSSMPPSSDGPGYRCVEAPRATSPQSAARTVAASTLSGVPGLSGSGGGGSWD